MKLGELPPWGYLSKGVLHDGPVGHPPGTLQHQVGVGVPLGGGVLQQQVPLVQLLTTPTKTHIHTCSYMLSWGKIIALQISKYLCRGLFNKTTNCKRKEYLIQWSSHSRYSGRTVGWAEVALWSCLALVIH